MKKKFLILASLFFTTMFAQAREVNVVVKGITPTQNGNTEVITKETPTADTIMVSPAIDVEFIYVLVKDNQNNIIQQFNTPATSNDQISVCIPSLPFGFFLEIRDDKGFVYTKNEE